MTRNFVSRFGRSCWALAVLPISQAAAASYFNKSGWTGVATEGVDPVAYFTERKPVKGSGKFSSQMERGDLAVCQC